MHPRSAVALFLSALPVFADETTEPPLYPSWVFAQPASIAVLTYDPGLSTSQNGNRFEDAVEGAKPGDFLVVGPGIYTVDSLLDLSTVASATAPIWILGVGATKPVITRPDNHQNTINFGTGGPAAYIVLSGFEITGGDIGVRLRDVNHMVIDDNYIHDVTAVGISANYDVSHVNLIRNHITGTGGSPAGPSPGEGIYLGGNYSSRIAHHCVVARNWIHDTSGTQGDGIEIKQGSWGNWVMDNIVHDTPYPGILVYGTDGNERNVIVRNAIWKSGDVALQVQGEAIVRNNAALAGDEGAFLSWDHQDPSVHIEVTHNTFVGKADAARLTSWSGRPGMVFANNVCYSKANAAIRFQNGSAGVDVTGNVVVGAVLGVSGGYQVGSGMSDFVNGSWTADTLGFLPQASGSLIGAASASHAAATDLFGTLRVAPFEAGAVEF